LLKFVLCFVLMIPFEMRTSVQFRIVYSIDNFFIRGQSFYIKSQNWGRELTTGENETERKGESASVAKRRQERPLEIPEFWENMCLQKGEEWSWGPIKINENSEKDR
jgi:hypothetical protein